MFCNGGGEGLVLLGGAAFGMVVLGDVGWKSCKRLPPVVTSVWCGYL